MEDLKTDYDDNHQTQNQRLIQQQYDRENLGTHRSNNINDENGNHLRDMQTFSSEYDVRKQRYIRISIMVIILGFLTVVTLTQSFLVSENVACIEDKVFNMTAKLNQFFTENAGAKHAYMIICGLLMDIMVLSQFYRFAMYGTTWRFPLALLMFYIMRAVMQQVFMMRYPEGYLWDFPGFYSITVPYGKTNDFFFSGHIGICIICFCEFKAHAWKKLTLNLIQNQTNPYFSIFTMFMQFSLMICLRGHYIIDLISGIVFAHYFWLLSERYSYIVDVKVFKIPFTKRFPMFTKSCSKCQHPMELWSDFHARENHPIKEEQQTLLKNNGSVVYQINEQ